MVWFPSAKHTAVAAAPGLPREEVLLVESEHAVVRLIIGLDPVRLRPFHDLCAREMRATLC